MIGKTYLFSTSFILLATTLDIARFYYHHISLLLEPKNVVDLLKKNCFHFFQSRLKTKKSLSIKKLQIQLKFIVC